MRVQIDTDCIVKASSQFWEQMLAMTLEPSPFPEEFCVDAGHLLGSVSLAGVWTGRVEVRMAHSLAYEATAAMMMQPVETVTEADALDATREIANMMAGSIKSMLPRPCSMTVPESAVETECFCGRALTVDSMVVAFRHAAGDLMVRVLEHDCQQQTDGPGAQQPVLGPACSSKAGDADPINGLRLT